MDQVVCEGLRIHVGLQSNGDKIISNYISEFSDDQVKLYITNRQRRNPMRESLANSNS